VITTRLAVADIAEHEHASAPRRDLEQLSSDAGAKLLRALGVKGHEADLQILYRGRFRHPGSFGWHGKKTSALIEARLQERIKTIGSNCHVQAQGSRGTNFLFTNRLHLYKGCT
jgi:hypothetical protein